MKGRTLPEQFHHRFARGYGARNAGIVLRLVEWNVEGMVDGRGQLLGANGVAGDVRTMLV